MKVGEAFVTVRPDTKGFEAETKSKLLSPLKAAAVAGGVLLGVGLKKSFDFIKGGIKGASDLNETVSKGKKIFGDSFAAISRWSRGSVTAMGLTKGEAIANASAFGDIFRQLKIGEKPATTMSQKMVGLAADFASFHNADITEVLLAQQSAFRGEFDALQRFVPGITAARVEQEALRLSHKKTAKDLTAAEKAQAAYNIMLRDGKRAAGDFKDTSQEQANQQRILSAQTRTLATTLGGFFLPGVLKVTRALTGSLMPALQSLATKEGPRIEGAFTSMGAAIADFISGVDLSGAATKLTGFLETLPSKVRDLTASLKEASSGVEGPALGQNLQSAADAASVFGVAIGFLADHVDLLAKALPALVVGFGLYKTAQAAAHLATIADVALMPARIASNFALAGSLRAVAASQTGVAASSANAAVGQAAAGAATQASALGAARAAAGWIAARVAMLAGAVATGVATAAQWALNVALSANPIGIVVIAIAAIVAAIIGWIVLLKKLYRENETFRRIVQQAWRGAQIVIAAAGRVWQSIMAAVGSALSRLASLAVTSASRVVAGWNTVVAFFRSIPGRIVGFLAGLPGMLFSAGLRAIQAFGRGIAAGAAAAVGAVSSVVSRVRGLLPFSPAKYGPLSGRGAPERSGRKLALDFAKGILGGAGVVSRAGERTLGIGPTGAFPGPRGAISGGGVNVAAGAVQVNVYTSGPTAVADVEAAVSRAFATFQRQLLAGRRV